MRSMNVAVILIGMSTILLAIAFILHLIILHF